MAAAVEESPRASYPCCGTWTTARGRAWTTSAPPGCRPSWTAPTSTAGGPCCWPSPGRPGDPVALRVEQVLDHLETYGTAAVVRAWLGHCRAGAAAPTGTLADLRREAGLSQRELAARLGSSQAQVARIEAASSPSLRSLRRYLQGLALTPVALVVAGDAGGRLVRLPAPASREQDKS